MARSEHGRTARFWRLRLLAAVCVAGVLGWLLLGKIEIRWPTFRIHTVEAVYGEVETRFQGTAMILRREQLVSSPQDGRVTLLVADGRSVRVGDPIAELSPTAQPSSPPTGTAPIAPSIDLSRAAIDAQVDELAKRKADLESRLSDAEKVMKDALTIGDSELVKDAQLRRDGFAAELSDVQNRLQTLERDRAVSQSITARVTSPSGSAPGHTVVRALTAGITLSTYDGLESQVVPGSPLDQFTSMPSVKQHEIVDGDPIALGEPILRIVEQQRVEVVVRLTRGAIATGMQLEVTFEFAPDRSFQAQVAEVLTEGSVTLARLRLDRFEEILLHHRRADVTLSADKAQGVVVPTRSIVENRGRQGVYLMLGEQPIFREVRILGSNDREAAVDGVVGVPVGARVVTNPDVIQSR